MGSAVLLKGLGNGVAVDNRGVPVSFRLVYVYERGSTNEAQVYADSALTQPLTQPLTTASDGTPGGIPGYVSGEQAIDFVDGATGTRTQAEPVSALDVVLTGTGGVNTDQVFLSDTGWNPISDPPAGLTTPTTARAFVGGHYHDDGGGGIFYHWGLLAFQTNSGTAPMTAVMGRASGWSARGMGAVARALGEGSNAHALEIEVGQTASKATATAVNGTGSCTLTSITPISEPCRFEVGNGLAGDGFGAGVTITSITGPAYAPTQIVVSDVTSTPGPVTVYASAASAASNPTIGLLITGLGAAVSEGGPGNPDGTAIHVQAYNSASAFANGLSFGSSSLLPSAQGILFTSVTADKAFEVDSGSSFTNALLLEGAYSGSVIAFSSVTGAASGISFSASDTFANAALYLPGHNIATDSVTGMMLATSSSQKIAVLGATPRARAARVGQLTDSTGGTASSTLAAISDTATRNAVASLAANVNVIEALLSKAGGGFGFTA